MPSTRLLKQWMWSGLVFVGISLCCPPLVFSATSYQNCPQGSLCTIGEFVYTDAAVPITNATCQFTSFDPAGQSFVPTTAVTGTVDGWYAYSFTPNQNTDLGTYPSQLCCQTTENDLCIDKTFDVTALPDPGLSSADVAGAVWNATVSGATNPGSFGAKVDSLQNNTLTANDIWSFSGRTLSNFGTLVSDIWNSVNRSLTNTQNITDGIWNANPDDYTNPDSFGHKINTTTNLTAEEVWEYTDREVTDATNISTSVWDYQNRSLTSFGNLVSSIWTADNRTATDPSGATSASLAVLERQIQATNTLIQELANQTSSGLDTSSSIDYVALLETKLSDTKNYLTQIANNLEIVSTKLGLLAIKWDQLSDSDRTQELDQILSLLGPQDSSDLNTLIGQLGWFMTSWPKASTTTLYQDINTLQTDINDFITSIQVSPGNTAHTQIINELFSRITTIKTVVGDISQPITSPTLYGQYKTNRQLIEALASQLRIINSTFEDWDHLSLADRDSLIKTLATDVEALNRFSSLKPLLSPITTSKSYLHNLRSVIIANQAALSLNSLDPLVLNWIGADATAFHTFVYNPSRIDSQTAPISYLLPQELTTENLSNTPANLTATFDPNQNSVSVTGSHLLDPLGHALDTLIVTDIWEINQLELDNLKNQSQTILASLEKSPLFPQATAINTAINQALDTIVTLQAQTHTPEAKIQAYRQIQILKQTITEQLQQLQDMANSSQNTNSLMGFIGGVQAVAVWGMIVIVIAGFIFLSLYMRALYQQTQTENSNELALNLPLSGPALLPATSAPSSSLFPAIHLPFALGNFNLLTERRFAISLTILSSLLLTAIVIHNTPTNRQVAETAPPIQNNQVLPLAPLEPSALPTPLPSPSPLASPSPTASSSAKILISPPDVDAKINLHALPSDQSRLVTTINLEESARLMTDSDDWIQVELIDRDPSISGWLHRNFAIILPM